MFSSLKLKSIKNLASIRDNLVFKKKVSFKKYINNYKNIITNSLKKKDIRAISIIGILKFIWFIIILSIIVAFWAAIGSPGSDGYWGRK